jgi:ABC-type uncharacterized transport system auxiliary subunit
MKLSARTVRLSALCLLSFVLSGLTGCSFLPAPQPDPTRHYVLTGPAPDSTQPDKMEGSLVLGLKRIEIAPYLNGKDMVVRAGGNEITYQNFARWAEPLTTSIGRALAGGFARSDKVARVYSQPFPFDVERHYDVGVRVLSCEGEKKEDGRIVASFSALVEVTEAKTGGLVVSRKVFVAPEVEWNGRDFGQLAKALNDGVDALGRDIIAGLPDASR